MRLWMCLQIQSVWFCFVPNMVTNTSLNFSIAYLLNNPTRAPVAASAQVFKLSMDCASPVPIVKNKIPLGSYRVYRTPHPGSQHYDDRLINLFNDVWIKIFIPNRRGIKDQEPTEQNHQGNDKNRQDNPELSS